MTKTLLTAAEIAGQEGETQAHPLNDNVTRVVKALGDATGLTNIGINIFETPPGHDTTAFHFHHFEEEAVYVLSGTATAEIGDETFQIGPGDFMGHAKGGLPHVIHNTGRETLRCLVIGQRLDHDVVDYPRQNTRLYDTKGLLARYVPIQED